MDFVRHLMLAQNISHGWVKKLWSKFWSCILCNCYYKCSSKELIFSGIVLGDAVDTIYIYKKCVCISITGSNIFLWWKGGIIAFIYWYISYEANEHLACKVSWLRSFLQSHDATQHTFANQYITADVIICLLLLILILATVQSIFLLI